MPHRYLASGPGDEDESEEDTTPDEPSDDESSGAMTDAEVDDLYGVGEK